jgi:transglutaminase-like putative cysteine protease
VPEELHPYLEKTALVQADDPQISRLARQEVKKASDALAAARALYHLVVRTVYSAEGRSVSTARGVLGSHRGDCDEQALLLVALARAAGIPARSVFGLLWEGGAFWGHAWVELWLGDWVAFDPAQRAESIGPGWLRLGEIPLGLGQADAESWRRLWLIFADWKIEITPDGW